MIDDDLLVPVDEESSAKRAPPPTMWVVAPSLNSTELEIRVAMLAEPVLLVDVEFIDTEHEAPRDQTPMNTELIEVAEMMADLYLEHIVIARAAGQGAAYGDYIAACRREGLEPLKLRR